VIKFGPYLATLLDAGHSTDLTDSSSRLSTVQCHRHLKWLKQMTCIHRPPLHLFSKACLP